MRKFILLFLTTAALAQLPALPNWVNNNELIDGTVTPAAYEYLLGASSWITGPPSGCTFGSPLNTAYPATATGLQAFIVAMEACRTYGINNGFVYGIILDLPVTSYSITSSIIIPQSNTGSSHATTPLIVRSAQDPSLLLLSEPVCAGGIQDNIPEAQNIGLRNPSCDGANTAGLLSECPTQSAGSGGLAYQLGTTTSCIPAGGFTLKNGSAANTSNYNYLQYMPQLNATSSNGPIIFCSVAPGATPSSQVCNNPSTTPNFAPDYWLFEDLAIGEGVGNTAAMNLITVKDNGGNANSTSQWASHIHFRRLWLHGDWTSLAAGNSQIADAIPLGSCYYCSVIGTQTSQMLRPGAEGHVLSVSGQLLKVSNNWLEGQSTCIFSGGSGAPSVLPVGSYVAGTDVEQRRTRCTFPWFWLGSPYGPGNVPNANPFWGGAGDNPAQPTTANIDSTGLNVTYANGPEFHDSTSSWPSNNIFLTNSSGTSLSCPAANPSSTKPATCKLVVASSWPQKCTSPPAGANCFPASPPTQLLLQFPACVAVGAAGSWSCPGSIPTVTGGGFILNGTSIVRKNGDEKKAFLRMLMSGNITENVDVSGGQRGVVADFSNRNTSGTAGSGLTGTNYNNTGNDLNNQNTIYRNGCGDTSIGVRSASSAGNGAGVTNPFQRLAFTNVLHYNISSIYSGTATNFCPSGGTNGMNINANSQQWDVTISGDGTMATVVAVASVDAGEQLQTPGSPLRLESDTASFNAYSGNNLTINASTGFVTGETVAFPCAACTGATGNSLLDGQTFVVVSASASTAILNFGSGFTGTLGAGSQVQGPVGFQVFGIPFGFPINITGCTNSAFNTSTTGPGPLSITNTSPGPASWTGFWSTVNTTIQYLWPVSGSGGTGCVLSNVQGAPSGLYITHNTFINDAVSPLGSGNSTSDGAIRAISGAFQDNILLNNGGLVNKAGWFASGIGEGTTIQTFQFASAGLTASNNVIPRPSGANALYTEYCNNTNVPVINCHASSPPTTIYFPLTGCGVGFIPPICSSTVPLTLPDYNDYGLSGTSAFLSSSSTSGPVGVILSFLNAAQTANTYACQVLGIPVICTNGPYPDNIGSTPPVTSPTAPAAKAFASLQKNTLGRTR